MLHLIKLLTKDCVTFSCAHFNSLMLMKPPLRPVREKLDQLELVDLREHRDPVERLALQDLLGLQEHRCVHHLSWFTYRTALLSVLLYITLLSTVWCIASSSLSMQGNPGTDGIPGAKGSAVSLLSVLTLCRLSCFILCSYVIVIFTLFLKGCPWYCWSSWIPRPPWPTWTTGSYRISGTKGTVCKSLWIDVKLFEHQYLLVSLLFMMASDMFVSNM